MDFISILELFGGVGLFLFGMSLMGSSLEQLSDYLHVMSAVETATKAEKHARIGAISGIDA